MEKIQRLKTLSSGMSLEPDGDVNCAPVIDGKQFNEIPITEAVMPNGKRIKLLKTLLSSACERNCYYCPFRAGRDMHRATFKPDEMAATFMNLHRAGAVEGLFLSSGIVGGGVRTQDKLIDTAEILRKKYNYRGYLHLKIMPGVERDQLKRSMQLSSRVSVNLEAPNTRRLQMLAPRKSFTDELLEPLLWAQEIRATQPPNETWNGRWSSTTTQFVVGAVGESDLELLSAVEFLFQEARLKRTYFSRFNPIANTPFQDLPPENPQRENRLYQASFLLRDYGFTLEDLPFDGGRNLPNNADPKLAWAREHLIHDPVDINFAAREDLLKVPGIGPKGAETILSNRRVGTISDLRDLKRLGIRTKRAAPFILLNGKQPAFQLTLL